MSSRIGIFGGSFDPPHTGHVLLAAYALSAGCIDEVIAVPTFGHPLGKQTLASFDHRVAMTERAIAVLRNASVSTLEAQLEAPSRTLHTLEALRQEHPSAAFRLIIGADILAEVDRWYRWDDVKALAPPLVVGRAGSEASDTPVPIELPAISSTEVRARLARGEPMVPWLPESVAAYIETHGLYR